MINKKILFGIMLFSLISGQIHTPPPPPVPSCDIDALKAVKINIAAQSEELKKKIEEVESSLSRHGSPTLLQLWRALVKKIAEDNTITQKDDAIDATWQIVLDSLLNAPRNDELRKTFSSACLQSEDVSSDFLDLGYAMVSGQCDINTLQQAVINKNNQSSIIQTLWAKNSVLAEFNTAMIADVWVALVQDKLNDDSMADATLDQQQQAIAKIWESLWKSLVISKNKGLHKDVSIECIKSGVVENAFLAMGNQIITDFNKNKPSHDNGGGDNNQPSSDDIAKLVNIIEVVAALP